MSDEVREAKWYQYEKEQDIVHCLLCPQNCHLGPGRTGVCRVRRRYEDKLHTLNYGRVTSLALDPIEKKPLYHFMPGSLILSAGTLGCNLACGFCQNWQISQEDAPARFLPAVDLIVMAEKARDSGNIGIAYTYSEPSVWYEYLMDTGLLARERGLKNIMVTNGYLNQEPLSEILPYLDAINMDLKSFRDDFYRRACHGSLEPVLRFAEAVKAAGVHLELTNLIIPGWNDNEDDIEALVSWIARLDPKIPLHLSRYYPQYRFTSPPTPTATMERAYEIARKHLDYVYLGNMDTTVGRDTNCPQCGETLIQRAGYRVRITGLDGPDCRQCGNRIPIVRG